MNAHEVSDPIPNSPFEEPREHWRIMENEPPERRAGRRPAMYFYWRPGAIRRRIGRESERPSD